MLDDLSYGPCGVTLSLLSVFSKLDPSKIDKI